MYITKERMKPPSPTAAATAKKNKVFEISSGATMEAWGLLDCDAQAGERHLHQHSQNQAACEFGRVNRSEQEESSK